MTNEFNFTIAISQSDSLIQLCHSRMLILPHLATVSNQYIMYKWKFWVENSFNKLIKKFH